MKKSLLFLSMLAISLFTLGSCSKDNPVTPDPVPGMETKTVKFTVTIDGASTESVDGQFIVLTFQGVDLNQSNTKWKVNGVVKNNESAVTLNAEDFIGGTKTYVIESLMPLYSPTASFSCFTVDKPFTLSYKAEINGQVITNDQNVTVEKNKDYNHDYKY